MAIVFINNNILFSTESDEDIYGLFSYNFSTCLRFLIPIIASIILIIYSLFLYSHIKKIVLFRIAVIILFIFQISPFITGNLLYHMNMSLYSSIDYFIPIITCGLLFFASLNIFKDTKIVSIAILITIAFSILTFLFSYLPYINQDTFYSILNKYLIYYISSLVSSICLYLGLFFILPDTFEKVETTTIPQDSSISVEDSLVSLKKEFDDGIITEDEYNKKRTDIINSL